jgi:hypothetical protein
MSQKLRPQHFRLDFSGFATNVWRVDLPEDQSFDDCLDPNFWMHVVDKVAGDPKNNPRGVGDDIIVFKRDAMAKRSYMISGIGDGFIKLIERAGERIEAAPAPELKEESPLQTRWNVGKRGHEVVREEAPGQVTVLAGPFQTKNEAVEWIGDHLQKMAA